MNNVTVYTRNMITQLRRKYKQEKHWKCNRIIIKQIKLIIIIELDLEDNNKSGIFYNNDVKPYTCKVHSKNKFKSSMTIILTEIN